MAYDKQIWDTTSYVNPTRMNHIEDGIESVSTATGTSYNNSTSGLVATNVQAGIDELRANVVNVNARLISVTVIYDNTKGFVLPSNITLKPANQTCYIARNHSTGALYLLCWYGQYEAFGVQQILEGNAPSNGEGCSVQYIGLYT